MPIICTAETEEDLKGILALQKANLSVHLEDEEIQSQGFVTVNHNYEQLKKMNDHEKHIIAKENNAVIGYVLAMTAKSKYDIPVLLPMFQLFEKIVYGGKKISEYNYMVVGQVCVSKAFRGRGIFDNCYTAYKEHYAAKYDFAITEIAKQNRRSLHAHKRIGFKEIDTYTSPDNVEWVVVLWDWRSKELTLH